MTLGNVCIYNGMCPARSDMYGDFQQCQVLVILILVPPVIWSGSNGDLGGKLENSSLTLTSMMQFN